MDTACDVERRGNYREYLLFPEWIKETIRKAKQAGAFETGCVSNRKGTRGTAVNYDVYGWSEDSQLVVIQVRQTEWRKERYNKVRKNYLLLGHNENGNVFAHPIDSPLRSRYAMENPEQCIQWVLSKIWDCPINDLGEIKRQGDIAFIPCDLPKDATKVEADSVTVRDTHVIKGKEIYQKGEIFYVLKKASAVHSKRQHGTVKVNGCYRVQPGQRALLWPFSLRVGD